MSRPNYLLIKKWGNTHVHTQNNNKLRFAEWYKIDCHMVCITLPLAYKVYTPYQYKSAVQWSDFSHPLYRQMMRGPSSKNGVMWPRFITAASAFCLISSQKWSVLFSTFDLLPLHHVLNWHYFFTLIIIITTTIFIVLSLWPRSLREFTQFFWWM